MDQQVKLDYGDTVRIINGEFKGRLGAVVGMNDSDLPSIFTVEFDDGSDTEVPLGFLEKLVKKVTPPVPTHTPEAEFSDVARRAHSGGTVVFQVLLDEEGSLRAASLLAVAGKGLDENAYAAVRKYKFKPATLEGIPVPFLMAIEVNFRM